MISILLLTIIVTGCEERDLIKGIGVVFQSKTHEKANISEYTTPPKVWSEGNMEFSYPAQTRGIRLELTAIDSGKGDAIGRLTGIEKSGDGVIEFWYVNVDGVKYRLLNFTQVWKKGALSNVTSIKVGDQINVIGRWWFLISLFMIYNLIVVIFCNNP
jgi:hypothetical protein